ncbi:5'(3')-deoxyribonucleotidase [Palleronia salina]|uniref:5'(3')-deoxyribonucleotidase n=1 Tax=Palleronia salina TaxID=313368 RepID=A0A1M6IAD9_9RHOB|nr:hypothetical protein [Palleronia salina]SHJ31365.1 5'(3')-deoxyribonucleotidase [Palleronia salina]
MRIAIDMDEVLADTNAAKLTFLRERGYSFTEDEMTGRKVTELVSDEDAARVETMLHRGVVFGNVDVIEGAQEALARLVEDHEVYIATAAMEYPASCVHKVAWMERHFPMVPVLNLVLCGDKSIIAADVLIDDSPRHFENFGGIGVCFDALHNRGQDVAHRLMRWSDAPDLIDRLEQERAQ